MGWVVYLCYPLLAVFLFREAKLYKKGEWNEGFLSLEQSKAVQGFCAIAIMLHHIGQKTCAPWLKEQYIVHGLDVFVPIGYWFAAIFFFCSGYGLMKSFRQKEDYLKGFFRRRFLPVIMAFVTTSVAFLVVGHFMGSTIYFAPLFGMSGPSLPNTYSWYIVVLLLLYSAFYLAFRYCKNVKLAIATVCAVVLAYMLYCDWWMYGVWWYNTIPLFCVGLLVAENEKKITDFAKKRYIPCVIVCLVLLVSCFLLSENSKSFFTGLFEYPPYELWRLAALFGQMITAASFTLLVFLLGMKVRIGNKALAFMGTITLEFYLIHGLFVQLFGFCYLDESLKPLFYIKNVTLMTLVVLVLSIASAIGLKYLHQFLTWFLFRKKELVQMYIKSVRNTIIFLIIAFVVTVILSSINSHRAAAEMEDKVAEYAQSTISYADVDGHKMAAYCVGEGEYTFVILPGQMDACPTISLKPLADDFAEEGSVVLPDYLGRGFSDATDKERTAEQMIYEIHTALEGFGKEAPYILVAHEMSGLYAQLFALTYPDEVKAMIMVDTCVAEQLDALIENRGGLVEEYQKALKKEEKVKYNGQRMMLASGFARMEWPVFEQVLSGSVTEREAAVLQEVFLKKLYNRCTLNEIVNNYDNCTILKGVKFPEDMPVIQLLSYSSCNGSEYASIDWEEMHDDLMTNPDIQEKKVMNGNKYSIYYNPHGLYKEMKRFLRENGIIAAEE